MRRHPPLPARCRCGKLACADVIEARYWRAWFALTLGPVRPVHYYTCRFGPTHWTSKTK